MLNMIDRLPTTSEYPEGFKSFLALVPENGLLSIMQTQLAETINFLNSIPSKFHDYKYAPGKWSIKQVVGHMCDSERLISDKVFCAGRGDNVEHKPPLDGNQLMQNAEFENLTMEELVKEFELIRHANFILFKHFPEAAWDRTVHFPSGSITVRAIGYLNVAHERHHTKLIKELYLKNN